jgi:hypothetical protein
VKPSRVSKFGIDDGSCFLCGGTVLDGFSTAASAMVAIWGACLAAECFERGEAGERSESGCVVVRAFVLVAVLMHLGGAIGQ